MIDARRNAHFGAIVAIKLKILSMVCKRNPAGRYSACTVSVTPDVQIPPAPVVVSRQSHARRAMRPETGFGHPPHTLDCAAPRVTWSAASDPRPIRPGMLM